MSDYLTVEMADNEAMAGLISNGRGTVAFRASCNQVGWPR